MESATDPPVEQARTIFDDLGYTLTGDGAAFRAERKWRSVRVTATAEASEAPADAPERFHCFVTWDEQAPELRDRIRRSDPDCEWAVIGVAGSARDYQVLEPPTPG